MAKFVSGPGSKIPGGGGRVRLLLFGMRDLMRSDEVEAELVSRMKNVQSALPGSDLEVKKSSTRTRVKVIRGSDFDEANTGDLSRALDLSGGRRGVQQKSRKPKRGA